MATYPCSNCGARADTVTGCPDCGRTPEEEIEALDRVIFSMQQRNRDMVDSRAALMARLQGAIATRTVLQRTVEQERQRGRLPKAIRRGTVRPTAGPAQPPPPRPVTPPRQSGPGGTGAPNSGTGATGDGAGATTGATGSGTGDPTAEGVPRQRGAAQPPPTAPTPPGTRTAKTTPAAKTTSTADATPTAPATPRGWSTRWSRARAATAPAGGSRPPRPAVAPDGTAHPPEGSPREMQNVLLGLGALLIGVAAVVLTLYLIRTRGVASAAPILAVLTLLGLAAPVPVAGSRLRLTATADTLAGLALLLFIPLDGYAAWVAGLHGTTSWPTYAALVCLVTAGVAAGYRRIAALRAPSFALVLALEPVFALLTWGWFSGAAGVAAVLAATAALNLAAARYLGRRAAGTPYLPETIFALYALALAGAAGYGTAALTAAHTLPSALAAAAALALFAAVALGAGLILPRSPVPDLGAGAATLAVIVSAGRLGAIALPGHGLAVAAATVVVTAFGVRLARPLAAFGPYLAGVAAATTVGVVVVVRGLAAIDAPVRAAMPLWRGDLEAYPRAVAHLAGSSAGELALTALLLTLAAVVMVPTDARSDAAVVGLTLTLLLTPAALDLPWAMNPALLCFAVAGFAIAALLAGSRRAAWTRIGAGFLLGMYAATISLAQPAGTALVLLTLAGIAALTIKAPDVVAVGPQAALVSDAATAGLLFALPGAMTTTTIAFMDQPRSAVPAVTLGSVTAALCLGYAALTDVGRRTPAPLPVLGATLGALPVAAAGLIGRGTTPADKGLAGLLLLSVVLLGLSPGTEVRRLGPIRLTRRDLATAAVTATVIAALARIVALLAPGLGLVTTAALVLSVSTGVRALPVARRSGPIVGAGLIGGLIGVVAGVAAVYSGIGVLVAAQPIWHADASRWAATVARFTYFDWQPPIALVLLGAAAAVLLPRRLAEVATPICLGLAALGAPAALALPSWSPVLVGGTAAAAFGLAAALSDDLVAGQARLAVAGVLYVHTVGASLTRPGDTARILVGGVLINSFVALVARLRSGRVPSAALDHLRQIGGAALLAALLSLPALTGTLAALPGRGPDIALPAALAGTAVGLALGALAGMWAPAYLPYVTGGVAAGATGAAVVAFALDLPAEGYASAAVLLTVVAEALRGNFAEPAGVRTAGRGRLRRGSAVALATAPAVALAAIPVLPPLAAALFGPYHMLQHIWSGPPGSVLDVLGPLADWAGTPADVVSAVVLTLAAALGAVGFPGAQDRDRLASRVVAVVIPGLAATLLIAPAALRLPWPAEPLDALVVAAVAGLGLALTVPTGRRVGGWATARHLVLALCLLATGAGFAGSLATREKTLVALAIAVSTGAIVAADGRTQRVRVVGWLVTAIAGHLLALVAGLVAGLPAVRSAFGVMIVAATLLLASAALPRLRRQEATVEAVTAEVSAYGGAVLALLLSAQSLPYFAAFCAAWGAVLSVAASRPRRARVYRTALTWFAAGHELVAWWIFMHLERVGVPEAYTLAFAVVALFLGWLESRRHPELGSWAVYGVALLAAFLPSLAIVFATGETPLRRGLLIVGAAATVVYGALTRRQAPLIVGGAVTAIAALHELALLSRTALLWTVLALVGGALVSLGANYEKRRRNIERLRGALGRLR
ncbi:MAG TPA: permease [Micromonosporaceae bacterium]